MQEKILVEIKGPNSTFSGLFSNLRNAISPVLTF